MHSLVRYFFYSQVWALRRSPFRDQRREVAKICAVSVLEIFHPYSVENLRDNVNLWWLQVSPIRFENEEIIYEMNLRLNCGYEAK